MPNIKGREIKPLTDYEKAYIMGNYQTKSIKSIAKHINRDAGKVAELLHNCNIKKGTGKIRPTLSESEKKYIIESYKTKSIVAIAEDLKRGHRVVKKCLTEQGVSISKCKPLTAGETYYIEMHYKNTPIWKMALHVNRGQEKIKEYMAKRKLTEFRKRSCKGLSHDECEYIKASHKFTTVKEMHAFIRRDMMMIYEYLDENELSIHRHHTGRKRTPKRNSSKYFQMTNVY